MPSWIPPPPQAQGATQSPLRDHRDALSRAFRAAFQVPDSSSSMAGLIRQERHRSWNQEFLAKATRG